MEGALVVGGDSWCKYKFVIDGKKYSRFLVVLGGGRLRQVCRLSSSSRRPSSRRAVDPWVESRGMRGVFQKLSDKHVR